MSGSDYYCYIDDECEWRQGCDHDHDKMDCWTEVCENLCGEAECASISYLEGYDREDEPIWSYHECPTSWEDEAEEAAEEFSEGAGFLAETFQDTLQMIGDRFVFGAIEDARLGDVIQDNLDWETRRAVNQALDEAQDTGADVSVARQVVNAEGYEVNRMIEDLLGMFREGNYNNGMERRGERHHH